MHIACNKILQWKRKIKLIIFLCLSYNLQNNQDCFFLISASLVSDIGNQDEAVQKKAIEEADKFLGQSVKSSDGGFNRSHINKITDDEVKVCLMIVHLLKDASFKRFIHFQYLVEKYEFCRSFVIQFWTLGSREVP